MDRLLSNGTRVADLREGLLRHFVYIHLGRLVLRLKCADARAEEQDPPIGSHNALHCTPQTLFVAGQTVRHHKMTFQEQQSPHSVMETLNLFRK
jgi:hypothetical protein